MNDKTHFDHPTWHTVNNDTTDHGGDDGVAGLSVTATAEVSLWSSWIAVMKTFAVTCIIKWNCQKSISKIQRSTQIQFKANTTFQDQHCANYAKLCQKQSTISFELTVK